MSTNHVTQILNGPKMLKFIEVDGEDLLKDMSRNPGSAGKLKIQKLKMVVDGKKKKLTIEIDGSIFYEKEFIKNPSVNISDHCIYNNSNLFSF